MASIVALDAYKAPKYDYIQDSVANDEAVPVDMVATKHNAAIQVGQNNFSSLCTSSINRVSLLDCENWGKGVIFRARARLGLG